MIRFTEHSVVFAEIPGHIALAINVSGCAYRCKGCHSPHLQQDVGEDLEQMLPRLLDTYAQYVDVVCFLGEGNDAHALAKCVRMCKQNGLMTALYSGAETEAAIPVLSLLQPGELDFLKLGPYMEDKGPLNVPTTNQRLCRLSPDGPTDITHLLWKESSSHERLD